MRAQKVEAVALASVVSLAFAILLSSPGLRFGNAPVVLLIWAIVAGMILGHEEVRRPLIALRLAVIPTSVLCLSPPLMALLRAFLAAAADSVPDPQNYLGYSIFNPGWWSSKPFMVLGVLLATFVFNAALLTVCSLAGGRILAHLSRIYTAGPAAFERVESIIKRLLAVLTVAGVFTLLS